MGCGWAVDGGQLDLSDSTGGVWLSNRKDLMANRVTRDGKQVYWTRSSGVVIRTVPEWPDNAGEVI